MQPSCSAFPLSVVIPRPSQKNLNREFLGARRIADDLGDHTSDPSVVNREYRFQIGPSFTGVRLNNGLAHCVHNAITPLAAVL